MRRRALLRTLAGLALVGVALLALLVGLVLREPPAYHRVAVPEPPERHKLSGEFVSAVSVVDSFIGGKEDRWQETFTSDQMNSYFEEDFNKVRPFHLPKGVHSPRVQIRPKQFELAFRYGHGFWSSVITVDLNVWLVVKEPNVVAVEVLGVRAGSVPVSVQSV